MPTMLNLEDDISAAVEIANKAKSIEMINDKEMEALACNFPPKETGTIFDVGGGNMYVARGLIEFWRVAQARRPSGIIRKSRGCWCDHGEKFGIGIEKNPDGEKGSIWRELFDCAEEIPGCE